MKLGIVGSGMIVSIALSVLKEIEEIPVSAIYYRQEGADKSKALADQYNIANQYTDLDEFLKDDSYDTVYLGVINSLHYPYAKKALFAGKNVIVEKPFTSNSSEAEELISLAKEKELFLFEAIMTRYSDSYEAIRNSLQNIGNIKVVQTNYSQYSSRYDLYRKGTVLPAFDPQYSGGALYDINLYNMHFVIGLFGKPESVHYYPNKGINGIDTSGVALLDYGSFKAVCVGAKDCNGNTFSSIQGEEGYIYVGSRMGFDEDVKLIKNKEEPICIGKKDPDNPMANEFRRISVIIEKKDYVKCHEYLDQTLDVMQVMELLRKDAAIVFDADHS